MSKFINNKNSDSSLSSSLLGRLGGATMNKEIKEKIIQVCNDKIAKKGENVGLSFYAFFKNKNDNPKLLMEVATWWIETHQLDHFEKAVKIKQMIKAQPSPSKSRE